MTFAVNSRSIITEGGGNFAIRRANIGNAKNIPNNVDKIVVKENALFSLIFVNIYFSDVHMKNVVAVRGFIYCAA